PSLDMLVGPGLYAEVYDEDEQQIIQRSSSLGESSLPLDASLLGAARRGQTTLETIQAGGTRLRIYTAPVIIGGQMEGVLQVAAPIEQVDQTQRQVLTILIVGGVVAVALSA